MKLEEQAIKHIKGLKSLKKTFQNDVLQSIGLDRLNLRDDALRSFLDVEAELRVWSHVEDLMLRGDDVEGALSHVVELAKNKLVASVTTQANGGVVTNADHALMMYHYGMFIQVAEHALREGRILRVT